MNFDEFTEKVKKEVEERTGLETRLETVPKNNGITLTALIIKDAGANTSPAIYLDSCYEEYQRKNDIGETVSEICRLFQNSRFQRDIDLNDFLVYEKAKGKIAFRLVNYERNTGRLGQLPHRRFIDLAITYYYVVQEPPFYGKASIQISNSHMQMWGVTEEELYRAAMSNTPELLPMKTRPIGKCMEEILEKELEGLPDGKGSIRRQCSQLLLSELLSEERESIPMYVMTNRDKLYGASCILYPDSVKEFADWAGCDVYILPSSVHEAILLPASEYGEPQMLYDMVRTVNREQVETGEQLSDNVYIYKRTEGVISPA